ncbi:alanine acetyltransferase [Alteromonas sp. KUL106]|uniref:alanine acetyltransferase n=1 Tax=Alteromonas sp. KUL106 TaxID=2480799 RepID=UPI0012E446F9|nr:alanine acetyltransferase [Alteromonas sp. KUL106]GFD68181.1 hypothetical protein KUL106_14440 [Alteromonas sp. KUL106]
MALTSYQQAILQEMGIPVWITKDAYAELKQEDQSKQSDNSAAQHIHGVSSLSSTQTSFSQTAQSNTRSSTPISQEEKQSRLAQLRANVGSTAKDKIQPKNADTAKPPSFSTSRNNEDGGSKSGVAQSEAKESVSPEGIPLSAEQKAKSQQWLKDLQLACVQLGIPSHWANTIMIGRGLSVTESAIVLPATPLKLTTVQKRALWAQLISAGRMMNNTANSQ